MFGRNTDPVAEAPEAQQQQGASGLPPLRAFKVRYLADGPRGSKVEEAIVPCHRVDVLPGSGAIYFEEGVWSPQENGYLRRWNRVFSLMVLIDFEEVVLPQTSSLIV